MAKKFFYVCAGLCLLSLSYQLGARSVAAQAGSRLVCAGIDPVNGLFTATAEDRTTYVANRRSNSDLALDGVHPLPPMPGSSPAIAIARTGGHYAYAILENGDVLLLRDDGVWTVLGNMVGVATSARETSWGKVKAHYRK